MRKLVIVLAAAMLGAATSVSAQQQGTRKRSFEEKVSKFWKKTKKELEQAGHELGDAIGFDDRIDGKSDLVKVNGAFYMPLYSTDLYKGDSAQVYRDECRRLFVRKYPKVSIMSVAIPQQDWLLATVERDGDLVGYQRTLHCFIIARDGQEGYISAKFTFRQYKDVGHDFRKVKEAWPTWERTDVMTRSVYNQLLKQ